MDRRTRNHIVRWMNDHYMYYTNATGLAGGCAEALDLTDECGYVCIAEELHTLARTYYLENRF